MGIFEKAIIAGADILEYIPQRAPIVMVDAFYGIDGAVSRSGLKVDAANIFCADGVMQDCGIIEHVAQSAALRVGYACKTEGRDVPIGFIGSVSKLKIHGLPKAGEEMKTTITVEQEIMNITLISAETRVENGLIAECQMKIYLTSDQ